MLSNSDNRERTLRSRVLGVIIGDRASKGFLSTTSDFAPGIATDRIIQNFIPDRLELINGSMLLTRLERLASRR